jgi:iron(III) transport system ATP-binding protein
VCKEFRRLQVLTDISFEVPEKAITAILGPSGEGKTTLLRLIAGFDRPTSGTLALRGKVVSSVDVHLPPEQRGVGIVPQDGALFPHLTVEENIAFGLPRHQHARVDEMLTLIGMTSQRNSRPAQLSGGQQQRVSLARALAPSPELILLDEPFSALDANMRSSMRDEVTAIIRKTESTAIIVTHDQEEAMSISDKVVVLLNGTVGRRMSPDLLVMQICSRPLLIAGGRSMQLVHLRALRRPNAWSHSFDQSTFDYLAIRTKATPALSNHGHTSVTTEPLESGSPLAKSLLPDCRSPT